MKGGGSNLLSSQKKLHSKSASLLGLIIASKLILFLFLLHCMKIIIFVLRKFVKTTENIIFSLVFVCLRFKEISYFLSFPSNENARKQHLSANKYSCVNMNFLYTIAMCRNEIFYVVLLRKQVIFSLGFRSTFH